MVDWEPLFTILTNHLYEMGVSITEVMHFPAHLVVILSRSATDETRLPCKVGNMHVVYYYEYEMKRPATPQSLCEAEPILRNQVELKRLTPIKGRKTGEFIYIGSSGTGFIEGSFKVTSFQFHNGQWVFTIWVYMGHDATEDLPSPVYGCAIWTSDGDVLGFVRHAPRRGMMKDWCAGIAADKFIDRGFKIVDTAN
ncbi:hypothetical protein V494_00222 [Pseudogymnoascus sp. VKM F-4513 (FW-928)]|nr:hypothetical protein V494_00222 [Pseudogymnoascus sp. VKM F-4513 (FW-928)]